jgi:hypothetical protein
MRLRGCKWERCKLNGNLRPWGGGPTESAVNCMRTRGSNRGRTSWYEEIKGKIRPYSSRSLLFYSEDGGIKFLLNVSNLSAKLQESLLQSHRCENLKPHTLEMATTLNFNNLASSKIGYPQGFLRHAGQTFLTFLVQVPLFGPTKGSCDVDTLQGATVPAWHKLNKHPPCS